MIYMQSALPSKKLLIVGVVEFLDHPITPRLPNGNKYGLNAKVSSEWGQVIFSLAKCVLSRYGLRRLLETVLNSNREDGKMARIARMKNTGEPTCYHNILCYFTHGSI